MERPNIERLIERSGKLNVCSAMDARRVAEYALSLEADTVKLSQKIRLDDVKSVRRDGNVARDMVKKLQAELKESLETLERQKNDVIFGLNVKISGDYRAQKIELKECRVEVERLQEIVDYLKMTLKDKTEAEQ